MTKMILDTSLRSRLNDLQAAVELHDESGQVVGYFLPKAEWLQLQEQRRLLYAWAQSQFSEEELDLAEQETEEFTTAEVLKHLSQL